MKRIACFGDVHGALNLLTELYSKLSHESLDEIWHLGDLIDRGPDPGGVVSFCREHGIRGVLGNHEGGLIEKNLKVRLPPKNKDKLRSYEYLLANPLDLQYLMDLPKIHLDLENNALLVHAGVWPWTPFYRQEEVNDGRLVCHVGMAHPQQPGASRWYTYDSRRKVSEEQLREAGWVRWYEAYDGSLDVYCGHRSVGKPEIYQRPGCGRSIFLDTGAHFTGKLTACIVGPEPRFISTGPSDQPR